MSHDFSCLHSETSQAGSISCLQVTVTEICDRHDAFMSMTMSWIGHTWPNGAEDDLQGARELLRNGAFDGLRDNIR